MEKSCGPSNITRSLIESLTYKKKKVIQPKLSTKKIRQIKDRRKLKKINKTTIKALAKS